MPRSSYGQCPIMAEGDSDAYVQVIGKTQFIATGLWCRQRAINGNGRSPSLRRSQGNDLFKDALAIWSKKPMGESTSIAQTAGRFSPSSHPLPRTCTDSDGFDLFLELCT